MDLSYIGLLCAVGSVIIFGIVALRKEGFSKKTGIQPILGITLCLIFGFMGWMGNRVFGSMKGFLDEIQGNRCAEKYLRNIEGNPACEEIDMEKYSHISRSAAEQRFFRDGTITEWTTPDGRIVSFEPNEQEEKTYKEMKEHRCLFEEMQKSSRLTMYIWIAVGGGSLVLGGVIPVRRKNQQD